MHALGRCPAPQQHIDPDQQIDESDKTQPIIERFIRRLGNDRGFQLHAVATNGVNQLGVDTAPVELTHEAGSVADGQIAYRDKPVSRFYAGSVTRAIGLNTPGFQHGGSIRGALHPPYAVVGDGNLLLLPEVEPGKNYCCQR